VLVPDGEELRGRSPNVASDVGNKKGTGIAGVGRRMLQVAVSGVGHSERPCKMVCCVCVSTFVVEVVGSERRMVEREREGEVDVIQ